MRPAQRAIFCLGQLPARVGTLVVQAGEAALERHRKASDHGIVRPPILQLVQHRLVAEPGIPANAGLRRGWWNRHKSLPCPAVCGAGCSPHPIHAVNQMPVRRDKRRAGAAGSTFSPQTQPPRGCCLGLAMRKKPVLWPFFALSVGLLTGLTLSVANTWLPKYVLEHRPLVNATHENQGVETT